MRHNENAKPDDNKIVLTDWDGHDWGFIDIKESAGAGFDETGWIALNLPMHIPLSLGAAIRLANTILPHDMIIVQETYDDHDNTCYQQVTGADDDGWPERSGPYLYSEQMIHNNEGE